MSNVHIEMHCVAFGIRFVWMAKCVMKRMKWGMRTELQLHAVPSVMSSTSMGEFSFCTEIVLKPWPSAQQNARIMNNYDYLFGLVVASIPFIILCGTNEMCIYLHSNDSMICARPKSKLPPDPLRGNDIFHKIAVDANECVTDKSILRILCIIRMFANLYRDNEAWWCGMWRIYCAQKVSLVSLPFTSIEEQSFIISRVNEIWIIVLCSLFDPLTLCRCDKMGNRFIIPLELHSICISEKLFTARSCVCVIILWFTLDVWFTHHMMSFTSFISNKYLINSYHKLHHGKSTVDTRARVHDTINKQIPFDHGKCETWASICVSQINTILCF